MNIEQARFNMIEQQIRPWNVLNDEVLHLLSVVKREDFVPLAHKALAFVDMEIPLGNGQTMLAPRLEARPASTRSARRSSVATPTPWSRRSLRRTRFRVG